MSYHIFPLYTISQAALSLRVALFLVSCILTDIAFALSALLVALLVVNDEFWPKRSYGIVASLVISFGILGTIAGEWLSVAVFGTWAYSEIMPIIPLIDVGLSPVTQWLAIPLAALWWSRRGHLS